MRRPTDINLFAPPVLLFVCLSIMVYEKLAPSELYEETWERWKFPVGYFLGMIMARISEHIKEVKGWINNENS